jgi:hypothetical protein
MSPTDGIDDDPQRDARRTALDDMDETAPTGQHRDPDRAAVTMFARSSTPLRRSPGVTAHDHRPLCSSAWHSRSVPSAVENHSGAASSTIDSLGAC